MQKHPCKTITIRYVINVIKNETLPEKLLTLHFDVVTFQYHLHI